MKTDEHGEVNRYQLTERQQKILAIIQANPKVQIDDIEGLIEASRSTVQREIQEIKKKIRLSYNKKTSSWSIN